MLQLKDGLPIMLPLYVILSILEVPVAQIFKLLIIPNVDALKAYFLLLREKLATIVSTSTSKATLRNNRNYSFNIKLNTHVPESLQTVFLPPMRLHAPTFFKTADNSHRFSKTRNCT